MNYFEMINQYRFDEVVKETLPWVRTNQEARIAFLRVFMLKEHIYLLDESVYTLLQRAADSGNPYAQYALGRYHSVRHPEKDSIQRSVDLFREAWNVGIADAGAGLSMSWSFGDFGEVDLDEANGYLEDALKQGSELAKQRKLKNVLFGNDGLEADAEKAMEMVNDYIRQDEEAGIAPNGMWYFLRGRVYDELGDRYQGLPDFTRATELGIVPAWYWRAYTAGYENGDEVLHKKVFDDLLFEGANHNDAQCITSAAAELYDNLDDIVGDDEEKRAQISNHIIALYNRAATYGYTLAMIMLGDIFRDGDLGQEESIDSAEGCYAMAALNDDEEGYTRLLGLWADEKIDLDDETAALYILRAVRLGSDDMLEFLIDAYHEGRMDDYKEEIEKYYIPRFEALKEQEEAEATENTENTETTETTEPTEPAPLESTGDALKAYIKQCSEYCDRAEKILQEHDDPSPIADMAREVIRLGGWLGQFEHTLSAAYTATKRMAECLYEHPRLLLRLKETELEILEYIEASQNQGRSMTITDDLRDEIYQLRQNIQAADEGRFEDIKTDRMLKDDPVEWTKEYEDAIDAADHEAYQHLDDVPRGMGFCFAYWAEKRNALARRGIEWRSPQTMNPRVLFD